LRAGSGLKDRLIMTSIEEIVARHSSREGPLLPILHDIQREYGKVDAAAETAIATALNLSRAEVHGVVSFYYDFTAEADHRPVIEVCRAEACKARGIENFIGDAKAAAGDRINVKTVYCLGLCSAGPAARVGDTLYARLDIDSLRRVMERL
jgi:formate dehydrogenase subunit gamma